LNFTQYQALHQPAGDNASPPSKVRALQCLLKEKGVFAAKITGVYNAKTIAAVRAWQTKRGFQPSNNWSRRDWITLLTHGYRPVLKVGSSGGYVRRVQRALNAANPANKLRISGVYDGRTSIVMRAYQSKLRLGASGVTNWVTWAKLRAGKY
jgi:peptidoglycan hydrolase-like protein with peptidoglycan-binding domain